MSVGNLPNEKLFQFFGGERFIIILILLKFYFKNLNFVRK